MFGYGPHWGMMSYGPNWGMMGFVPKWGMMNGVAGGTLGGPAGLIAWPLLLVAATAGVVWFLRSTASPIGIQPSAKRGSTGLDVLEERYARGEISRDEYLQKKQDMN